MADLGIKTCDVCKKELVLGKKGERYTIIKDGDTKFYRHRTCFDKTALKSSNKSYRFDPDNNLAPNTDLTCNLCGEKIGSVCMLSPDYSAEDSFTNQSRQHFSIKHGMKEVQS